MVLRDVMAFSGTMGYDECVSLEWFDKGLTAMRYAMLLQNECRAAKAASSTATAP